MTTDPVGTDAVDQVDPVEAGAGEATAGGDAADRDDRAGPERRQLSDFQVVAMAAVAWGGALVAQPLPLAVGTVAGAAALALRRPLLLIAAAGLLASGLGHRSAERFVPIDPAAVTELEVVLVDDPRPVEHGWRATVRLPDGRRVEAVAHGSAGARLFVTRVGGRLLVDGALDSLDDTSWARSRHLLGRLRMATAVPVAGPTGWRAVIETLRDRVVAGAEPLPEAARPLYLGLVVGEDRFQQPDQRARFAAAGLAHLLAVSGQNVAFALVLLRPVTGLLGHRGRFVATIVALVVIAVATRAEPSVLRATLTAGFAASASLTGDRQSGLRLLGLAVTALVLIDPFLTRSVGFQLSVAASAGILLLTPILTGRLRGPSFLVEPLAVTIAAQAAVTPILIGRFGPVSLGSVPANLLGGWAAGLVMMWGLTVGVVAGALGGWAARWLQLPAFGAIAWLDAVAGWATRIPAPLIDGRSLALLAATAIVWRLLVAGSAARTAVVAATLVVLLVPAVPRPPPEPADLPGGGRWLPAGGGHPSVLIVGAGADRALLETLLARRIRAVDLVIIEAGSGRGASTARSVLGLVAAGTVLAPPQHRIVGARRLTTEWSVATAASTLHLVPDGTALTVTEEAPVDTAGPDG